MRQTFVVMQVLVDIADFPVSYQYAVVSRDGQHSPEQGPEREVVPPEGASLVLVVHLGIRQPG